MKKLILAATALTMLATTPLYAQSTETDWRGQQLAQGRDDRRDDRNDRRDNWRDERYERRDDRRDERRFERGNRLPQQYRGKAYVVKEYKRYNLRKPPRGYQWVRADNRYMLVGSNSWKINEVIIINQARPGNRDELWRKRYSRAYTVNDDNYYNECRSKPDPAGALVGALVGGLMGRTVAGRGDRTEGTIIGVIAGGALGAALTSKVDCEDRSYIYRTYADGFNDGRPNRRHEWNNPRSGNRGEMRVLDYYNDEDDFHCAVFTNTIYIGGRPQEARGRACQQPNGSWAIID